MELRSEIVNLMGFSFNYLDFWKYFRTYEHEYHFDGRYVSTMSKKKKKKE